MRSPASQRFKDCSEATLQRIKDEDSLVRFGIGHALSSQGDHSQPGAVALERQGPAARHSTTANSTPWQYGPGNFVGLPPCSALKAAKK